MTNEQTIIHGDLILEKNTTYEGDLIVYGNISVKNVSDNKQNSWKPDKDDMQRVKNKAKKLGLIKIGNVHTHPYPNPEWEGSTIEDNMRPSNIDLKFAQKFNDLVRIIWVVQKGAFLQSFVHDKYGNEIPIALEGIEKESDVVD